MATFSIVVFGAALAALAFDFGDRTKIALTGAAAVVVAGALGEEEAVAAVDWSTLGLLAGMMIIVARTERTGVFTYVALRAAQLSQGRPLRLVFLLALVTGVLSAFLDNLTAILLVVPVTLLIGDLLRVSAIPLVLVEVLASNIGGTATLIGDPPNIMIGTHVRELSFVDFIVNLAPVSFLTLILATLLLYAMFRSSLQVQPDLVRALAELDPARDMRGRPYVKRSLAVLIGTVVGFFLHAPLHLEPSVVALTGATVMLLVAATDVDEALREIQWPTLFFFIGLFIMVGALEEHGVIESIADGFQGLTGGSETKEALVILWGSALGSGLVDNIPFTAAMIPVVDQLQLGSDGFEDANWWALALGACFGGNATLIAAAANVAAAGVLTRAGQPISFVRFLSAGLPVTLLSLLLATGYLILFQV